MTLTAFHISASGGSNKETPVPTASPVTVVVEPDRAWEGPRFFGFDVSLDGRSTWILYNAGHGAELVGGVESRDGGASWTKRPAPVMTAPDGTGGVGAPCVLPGRGLVLGFAPGGDPARRGIYAWRTTPSGPFRLDADLDPMVMNDEGSSQTSLYPGHALLYRGKIVLFSHGAVAGRSHIFRSESPDGITWSRSRIVLSPSTRGFDAGTVSEASIYRDPVSGRWTLWYIANPSRSEPGTILGRAQSVDGIVFTNREAFLHPEWFGPATRYIHKAVQCESSGGSRLFLSISDASGRGRIVRLNLANPHTAPVPIAPNRSAITMPRETDGD